jgi:hypothetical protein
MLINNLNKNILKIKKIFYPLRTYLQELLKITKFSKKRAFKANRPKQFYNPKK